MFKFNDNVKVIESYNIHCNNITLNKIYKVLIILGEESGYKNPVFQFLNDYGHIDTRYCYMFELTGKYDEYPIEWYKCTI